jgi:hypothetical protein
MKLDSYLAALNQFHAFRHLPWLPRADRATRDKPLRKAIDAHTPRLY